MNEITNGNPAVDEERDQKRNVRKGYISEQINVKKRERESNRTC